MYLEFGGFGQGTPWKWGKQLTKNCSGVTKQSAETSFPSHFWLFWKIFSFKKIEKKKSCLDDEKTGQADVSSHAVRPSAMVHVSTNHKLDQFFHRRDNIFPFYFFWK